MSGSVGRWLGVWGGVAAVAAAADVIGGDPAARETEVSDAAQEWDLLQEFAAARRAALRDILRQSSDPAEVEALGQAWLEQHATFEEAYQELQDAFSKRSFGEQLRASAPHGDEDRVKAHADLAAAHEARARVAGDPEVEEAVREGMDAAVASAKESLRATLPPPTARDIEVAAANDLVGGNATLSGYLASPEGVAEIKALRRSIRASGVDDSDLVDIAVALRIAELNTLLQDGAAQ